MNKGNAHNNRPSYDDRKGLGYGQLEPTFHVPKMAHDEFPYITPDEHEDVPGTIDSEDLDAFVQKINMGHHITDFMSDRKNDPDYFVAGNTSLGESTLKNSLVPLPTLYKNIDGVFGGTSSAAQTNAAVPSRTSGKRLTGDTVGWASPPPPIEHPDNNNPAFSLDDIPSEEERDAGNILDLRNLISAIHREQELEARLNNGE